MLSELNVKWVEIVERVECKVSWNCWASWMLSELNVKRVECKASWMLSKLNVKRVEC